MPPKKSSKSAKRGDLKHGGKNGKKGGLSGSSFFTWFMVIALLGVWTSVAVVWFDLVDYEDVLGKLGVYDADGDGDFDVDDAKILLGLKERTVFEQNEDSDETDIPESIKSGLSDADLKDIINDIHYDELNDIEDALDDHQTLHEDDLVDDFDLEDALETEYDVVSDFDLEDAVEHSVHESLRSEYVEETKHEPEEAELGTEEPAVAEEEPEAEEQAFVEVDEPELEQEPEDDEVQDSDPEYETETEHEPEAEVFETTNIEEEDEEVENEEELIPLREAEDIQTFAAVEQPEVVVAEEQVADDEQEPQDDHETVVPDNREDLELYEESELLGEEVAELEPAEEEPVPDGQADREYVPEETEESPPETLEEADAVIIDDDDDDDDDDEDDEENTNVESLHPPEEEQIKEADEQIDLDQHEAAENPVEDDRPHEKAAESNSVPTEEHTEKHADTKWEQTLSVESHPQTSEEDRAGAALTAKQRDAEQLLMVMNKRYMSYRDDCKKKLKELNLSVNINIYCCIEGPTGDESSSQEKKDKDKKKKPKLLNKFDKTIKSELDAAEKLRKKGKVDEALKAFESLVTKYPQSPRARYGKAQAEDDLAEKLRSNEILLRAIGSYEEVSGLPNVPKDLAKLSLKRRANRQQFLGRMQGSLLTLQKLVQLYPEDISLKNDLGVGYLLIGDNKKAKEVYEEVLSLDPNNGFGKVHYGFILKAENNIAESIPYLKEGLLSGEPGTDDGRFYFHLGDALQRVGDKEAYTWYEAGHKKGYFASVWQRSLYNVDGLKAQPWWTPKETGYTDLVRSLEANWKIIRDEALAVMDDAKGLFVPEDENLRETGDWSQYTLWQQGRKNDKSCNAAPRTCGVLDRFPESTGCRRGQIKYSIMHPGTHVWPHTGPTNCRLRMHLGLVIPRHGCRIRCANDTRTWEEGKVLIFDDSFEHEVWQEADSFRLIFIVDVWHPELTQQQRRTLPAI
ncbi:aspartyl/asparaginyl beta-hydroxylase [Pseudophryne corroboree]|uniref:aspartyl/asparaginyl beta-hydroxylase n=1 Tax=Pseudophryne corroboree TaxID=495146 RepID=UPI0030813B7C